MESGPPLNLSTSVKVENINEEDLVQLKSGQLVQENDGKETYLYLQADREKESLTITGEIVEESFENVVPENNEEQLNEEIPSYKCIKCSKNFNRASLLRKHMRSHGAQKVLTKNFKCSHCSLLFETPSDLNKHKKVHMKRSYECETCDVTMESYAAIRAHIKTHKVDKKFKCKVCPMQFFQQGHLATHIRKHTGEKPFACTICDTKFKQVSHLTTHLRIHTNDRPYVCTICNASFSQTGSLKRHKRSHTGEKPFKCEQCNAVFVEKRNLNRHALSHSGIRPFECKLCSASFTQMIDLKRHVLSHSGIKPFKCDTCEAGFSRKNNLRWHKMTHEGYTPYICEICKVGFRVPRDLKNHMRSHGENRPYTCDHCNASFVQLSTLTRHELIHSGKRPFSCQYCNKSFFEKASLKRHEKQHKNNQIYDCDVCSRTFPQQRLLQKHKVLSHNIGSYDDDPLKLPIKENSNLKENESSNDIIQNLAPQPMSNTNDFILSDSQEANQTIFMSQPGQPPKTGKPAMNCQNHKDHVHTLMEGTVNQWQTWCFCDSKSQNSSESFVSQTTMVADYPDMSIIDQQNMTNTITLPESTSVINKCEGPNSQVTEYIFQNPPNYGEFNSGLSQQIISVSENSQLITSTSLGQTDSNAVVLHKYESQMNKPIYHNDKKTYSKTKAVKFDKNVLINSDANQSEDSISQFKILTQPKVVHEDNSYLPSEQGNIVNKLSMQSDTLPADMCETPSPPNDKEEVNLQYSLTINNPAAGNIQIQSDVFPIKQPPSPKSKSSVKKNRGKNSGNPKELRIHVCPICGRVFDKKNTYDMHLRTHTGEKPFVCGVCYLSFAHNNSLMIHMRSHTGEKPYSCIYCKATFAQKSNLRVHHRTHTGEKPFACEVCKSTFSQGSHLKAHIRIHNNDRPFICVTCGQAFTQKSALKRHQLKHGGVKAYACLQCEMKFNQRDDLQKHIERHTKDKKKRKPPKKYNAKPLTMKVESIFSENGLRSDNQSDSTTDSYLPSEQGNIVNKLSLQMDSLPSDMCETPSPTNNKEEDSTNCDINFTKTEVSSSENFSLMSSTTKQSSVSITIGEPITSESLVTSAVECVKSTVEAPESIKSTMEQVQQKNSEETSRDFLPEISSKDVECIEKESSSIKQDVARSPKSSKKDKKLPVNFEPTRISRRIKEAAHKKKNKFEDSDFITGNDIDIVEEFENSKVSVNHKKKSLKKAQTDQMQSWCFCEIPHGPDEPHNQQSVYQQKPTTLMTNAKQQESENTVPQPTIPTTSYGYQLQLPQNVSTFSTADNLVFNTNLSDVQILNSSNEPTLSSSSVVAGQIISDSTVGQLMLANPQEAEQRSIISSQVISGSQLIAGADGTFYIDASDILSNGAVVLNPSSGTFILDLASDGQLINVPIGTNLTSEMIVPGTTVVEASGNVYSSSPATNALECSSSICTNVMEPGTIHEAINTDEVQTVRYATLENGEISLYQSQSSSSQQPSVIELTENKIKTKVEQTSDVFKCSVCGKVFAHKVSLKHHMDESHPGLHCCSICFDAFTSKEHLISHKLTHQSNNTYSCSQCPGRFRTKSLMNEHMQKIHKVSRFSGVKKEERSFICITCDSRFHQLSDLKRHNLSHTGEKPFKCSTCTSCFTRKFSLKKHERIHTGERPYRCEECLQTFAYRHQFNKHMSTVHGEETPKTIVKKDNPSNKDPIALSTSYNIPGFF